MNDIKILDFINFIYINQKENELFFTIKKNKIQEQVLNVKFKNQYFDYTRDLEFDLEYNEFEDFINNLTKYNGFDYYKNEDGYHFILLNSPEEDISRLRDLISSEDIYSVYLDDNTIYLKYKNSSYKSILELLPSLSNEEIKNIINEYDCFKSIDSYYYISNNL